MADPLTKCFFVHPSCRRVAARIAAEMIGTDPSELESRTPNEFVGRIRSVILEEMMENGGPETRSVLEEAADRRTSEIITVIECILGEIYGYPEWCRATGV